MRRAPAVDAGSGIAALAYEHRAGDLALQGVQVVAQRAAGDRLPVAVDRQSLDLLLDPGEPDALADVEIGPRRIADLDAATACAASTRSSAQCSESSEAMRVGEMPRARAARSGGALDAQPAPARAADSTDVRSRATARRPARRSGAPPRSMSRFAAPVLEQPVAHVAQQPRRLAHGGVLHRRPGCGCREPRSEPRCRAAANTSRAMV